MNKISIELEDYLVIEVCYYWQSEEPAEIGPDPQYPGCGASVEDVSILSIEKGSIDDLVDYVENVNDFHTKLDELIYDKKIEMDYDEY